MEIQRAAGAPALVVSVTNTGTTAITYNLTVADWETYFVGEARVWVHNCREIARSLGFRLDRSVGRMHGQDVFRSGRSYISRDVDSHSGGYWKMFEMRGGRLYRTGTYNEDLTVRIGD